MKRGAMQAIVLVLLGLAGPVSGQDGLVAYYPLNEGRGTVATDQSGSGNDGAINGASWRTGPAGTALYFDGSNDYVDCGTDSSLRIETAGTISLWFNPTQCQGGLVNWSTGQGWPDERLVVSFNTWAGAEVLGVYLADGSNHQRAYEGPFPPVNQWIHFAVTFDGTTVSVYRDGSLVGSVAQSYQPNLSNVPLWLGRSQGLGAEYFHGLISEVRIYNRAISPQEVSDLYAAHAVRFKTARALNNLCWEILNKSPGGPPEPQYSFYNPRWQGGWVYFLSQGDDTLTLTVPTADPPIVRRPGGGETQEAMRYLPAGDHQITVAGGGNLASLIVRSIPELHYSQFQYNPFVREYGPYDWGFLDQGGVLANVNTIMAGNTTAYDDRITEWAGLGRAWICHAPAPVGDADNAYSVWSANQGYQNPLARGVISDEYGSGSSAQFDAWTEAVQRLHDTPGFEGKWFIPYLYVAPYDSGPRTLVQKCVDLGYAVAFEVYLPEPTTEAAAQSLVQSRYADAAAAWDSLVPGSVQRLIMVPGYLSAPEESLNINPGVNYKVFMDMQMHTMATAPSCMGLYGIQWYLSGYCDEENIRYAAKLLRHYAIEGRTDRMNNDPYILPHVANGDFESGGAGWTLIPAEPGSMQTRTADGYSWIQGRYPPTDRGETFLWTRRSATAPNVFSQQINNLTPGRLYSLKMFTGDYGDWVGGVSEEKTHAVTITLDGAEVLPGQAFASHVHNNYSHSYGPFNVNNRFWMNYHWRVFQALSTTGTITVSDWAGPDDPGGPIGQELMFNFIEIQPYLPPVYRLNVLSSPVRGVAIDATPTAAAGTTAYSTNLEFDTEVTLTAPPAVTAGGQTYDFERWYLLPDLAGHFPMDEGAGTVTQDVSGNGNDGTIYGATWETSGLGPGLAFDGVSDYVDCGAGGALDPGGQVTLCVWVNPDEVPPSGERGVAGKGIGRYQLTYYVDGRCWWYVGGGGNNVHATLDPGRWTYVVGTFDGAAIRLYLDGQLVGQQASTTSSVPAGGSFLIGWHEGGGYFNGSIADVKVYSRALSDAEVLYEYQNGPTTYAGEPQPDGQAVLTLDLRGSVTALAQYQTQKHALDVASTPIQGIDISGFPGGTTDYSAQVDDNAAVSLTAPATVADGEVDYQFRRWTLNGDPQPDGQVALAFAMSDDAVAVAEYVRVTHPLRVFSRPITGIAITGTHPGTTNYAAGADDESDVTLTAPISATDNGTTYQFVRWDLVEDLAAHFPIDEGAGSEIYDVSGHENSGAIDGAVWVATADGYALSFDGIDDGVDCGNSPSLDLTGPVSISAWIYPDAIPSGEMGVAGKDLGRFLMTYYVDGYCYFYIGGGGNDARGPVPTGQWSHVVGTFDGTTIRFYRNGSLVEEFASAYSTYPTGGTFWLGRRTSAGHFPGKIADVKVYARALSDTEVADEYAFGPWTYAGTPQPPGQNSIALHLSEPATVAAVYEPSAANWHPCDVSPYADCATAQDWRIELCEMVGYAAAWKRGDHDDLAAMVRGAFLWKAGEYYHWDVDLQQWYPGRELCTNGTDDDDDGLVDCADPSCADYYPACTGGSPQSGPSLGPGPTDKAMTLAQRRLTPSGDKTSLTVSITINAPPETLAVGLEDAPPPGSAVSDIADGGQWDRRNGKVKWGPWFDGLSRTVGYTVTLSSPRPGVGRFEGTVSIDGLNQSVAGDGAGNLPAMTGSAPRDPAAGAESPERAERPKDSYLPNPCGLGVLQAGMILSIALLGMITLRSRRGRRESPRR